MKIPRWALRMVRLVICDDSRSSLAFFEKKLTDAGYEIVGKAQDGDEGIRIFKETHPDAMLLDVTMPNKDGRECLDEILKYAPTAKVIMISAVKDEGVQKECLSSGAKAFISKSNIFDAEAFKVEVLSTLEKVLKGLAP